MRNIHESIERLKILRDISLVYVIGLKYAKEYDSISTDLPW